MADPVGRFNVAFDDPPTVWEPTWTRLDTDSFVASYTIDRGRQYETDTTDTGRATVEITDRDGTLDPTNPGGPYYGQLDPMLQAVIQRYNPVLDEWQPRFRGFIDDYDYVFDPSQRLNKLVVNLVDLFEIVSAVEMTTDLFGDHPADANGQIVYLAEPVDERITHILDDSLIFPDFYVVFSGNVEVYRTVYAAGESALLGIQEAADAEFPGVSNLYCDRHGRFCFHGRLAKYDPVGVASGAGADTWTFHQWHAGDGAAVTAAPSTTAHIRRFAFNRGLSKIINTAVATPWGIDDDDLAGQQYSDATSRARYGARNWSAQSLLTKRSYLDGSTALQETRRFARYYVDNYKNPQNRITEIGFRTIRPGTPGNQITWRLLCELDIADSVAVTVASPGGGGFDGEEFFVEGVHETSRPLNPDYDDIEMTLDLSPASYFDHNPWADDA